MAVNTDIEESQLPVIMQKLGDYSKWGIQDFIVKTPQLMRLIKEKYPAAVIHASVGCNINTFEKLNYYKRLGVSQFVISTLLKEIPQIRKIKKEADRVNMKSEVLIYGNRCIKGVGGCRLYQRFRDYFQEINLEDTDGTRTTKIMGDPDKGGICFRPCIYTDDRTVLKSFKKEDLKVIKKNRNVFFAITDDIQKYIDLRIDTLKIQGREYPPEIIGRVVGLYRKLIDSHIQGELSVNKFEIIRHELEGLNKKRENIRKSMTSQLHKIMLVPSR